MSSRDQQAEKPEGCICTVHDAGTRDFKWEYKTTCPVTFKDHPEYCSTFQVALDGGWGMAKAMDGGTIIINDGSVSDPGSRWRQVWLT